MSRGSGRGVGRGPVLWRLEGRRDLDFSLAWGPFLEPLQPLPLAPPPSLYQDRREDTGPPGNPGSPHLRGLHLVPCAKSQFCCGRHRGSSPRGRTRPSRGDVTLPTIVSSTLPERFPQRLPSACRGPGFRAHVRASAGRPSPSFGRPGARGVARRGGDRHVPLARLPPLRVSAQEKRLHFARLRTVLRFAGMSLSCEGHVALSRLFSVFPRGGSQLVLCPFSHVSRNPEGCRPVGIQIPFLFLTYTCMIFICTPFKKCVKGYGVLGL